MPNHVTNEIRAAAPVLDKIRAAFKSKESAVDFNALIPVPEALNGKEARGDIEDMARLFMGEIRLQDILRPPRVSPADSFCAGDFGAAADALRNGNLARVLTQGKMPKDMSTEDFETLLRYMRCIREYGYPNWLSWRIARWGTKWNAYSVHDEGDRIRFETAWSCPGPIVAALAEAVPDPWEWDYADEDIGSNCGMIRWDGAEMTRSDPRDPEVFAWILVRCKAEEDDEDDYKAIGARAAIARAEGGSDA